MTMFALLFAAAAPAATDRLPPAQALPPPAVEEQAVLAPIYGAFAALAKGDAASLLRFVYPDGRVTATGTRASTSGLRQESWNQFAAARVKPGEGFEETIADPAIEIDGDIAMVWAPYVVRAQAKVLNCGIDHFDLVRDGGVWRIMNLSFSSRIADCPQ